jgi:alpha-tubulin suppressor-like RCC1 family protein
MLGTASINVSATPVQIPPPTSWTSSVLYLSLGEDHVCAINSDKFLYCWGSSMRSVSHSHCSSPWPDR